LDLKQPLNRYIDHTLLKPDATLQEFQKLVDEAVKYNFASVCVSPYMAEPAVHALKDHPDIKVCTVVGFPHGNIPFPLKVMETEYFIERGVHEIDFVLNVGLLRSGMYDNVGSELEHIGLLCRNAGVVSKCIVESCYLTIDEKTFMFRALSEKTAVDFIKTSTGFGTDGADLRDVMDWNARRNQFEVKNNTRVLFLNSATPTYTLRNGAPLKIKAAGGIRDLDTALKFIACGADRLGMSASVKVMEEWNARNSQTFTGGEEQA
jgi:deoxyribose-phosphate aldolase